MLSEKINKIRNEAILQIQSAANEDEINAIRVKFLGGKSEFTSILKGLGIFRRTKNPLDNLQTPPKGNRGKL